MDKSIKKTLEITDNLEERNEILERNTQELQSSIYSLNLKIIKLNDQNRENIKRIEALNTSEQKSVEENERLRQEILKKNEETKNNTNLPFKSAEEGNLSINDNFGNYSYEKAIISSGTKELNLIESQFQIIYTDEFFTPDIYPANQKSSENETFVFGKTKTDRELNETNMGFTVLNTDLNISEDNNQTILRKQELERRRLKLENDNKALIEKNLKDFLSTYKNTENENTEEYKQFKQQLNLTEDELRSTKEKLLEIEKNQESTIKRIKLETDERERQVLQESSKAIEKSKREIEKTS